MIKLIAIDIDGTLLPKNQVIPQKTIEVIKNIVKSGIYVVLASGRGTNAVEPIQRQLGISEQPAILLNGVILKNGSDTKTFKAISEDIMIEIYNFCEKEKFNFSAIFGDSEMIISNSHDEFQQYVNNRYNHVFNIIYIESLAGIDRITGQYGGPTKINIIHDDTKIINYALELASKKFEDRVTVRKTGPYYLDFSPYKINKGRGLQLLLSELGINRRNIIAIGDAENDIEMLELAGTAVAMENALDSVKAVADYITEDNNNEGVRIALERLIDNKYLT